MATANIAGRSSRAAYAPMSVSSVDPESPKISDMP